MKKVKKQVRFDNPIESVPKPSSARKTKQARDKEYYYPILTQKKSLISSFIDWSENVTELQFKIHLFTCLGNYFQPKMLDWPKLGWKITGKEYCMDTGMYLIYAVCIYYIFKNY